MLISNVRRFNLLAGASAGLLAAGAARAQDPAAAGALPPIKPLAAVQAASKEHFGAVSQVRALPDGRLLVNDNLGRKVVLLDGSLAPVMVVADTTSATANAYSSRAAGLIAGAGDTTYFVDPSSLSMLVIDGKGQVVRVMSVPRPGDAGSLIGGPNGTPGFDAQGRLVYRGAMSFGRGGRGDGGGRGEGRGGRGEGRGGEGRGARGGERGGQPGGPGGFPGFQMPEFPDSLAIVRISLATRKLDTAGFVKIPKQNVSVGQGVDGRISVMTTIDPMPIVDDWAVTADGRVALLRGRDYRLEFVGADGTVESSHKLPFAWRQLSDSAKEAFIDSTRTAMEKLREQALARMQAGGAATADLAGMAAAAGATGLAEIAGAAGGAFIMRAGVEAGRAGGRGGDAVVFGGGDGGRGRGGQGGGINIPPLNFIPAQDLPDYAPPFNAGSMRADADGNIWIRTTLVYNGGSVYDVVNAKGQLTDRLLLPPGRVIAGFGKGGVVYMGVRDAEGVRLEKATIR